MVDYEKLAELAKKMKDASTSSEDMHSKLEADTHLFFQKVTAHIGEEMKKANIELQKRKIGVITRNYLPNFEDVVFLSIGTELLCKVELDVNAEVPRINAIIIGPPHRDEIARKQYILGEEASGPGTPKVAGARSFTVGASPQEIAQDIITGIVIGRFS